MVRRFLFVGSLLFSLMSQAGVPGLDFHQAIEDTVRVYHANRNQAEPVIRMLDKALRPRLESEGLQIPPGETLADVLYEQSLSSVSLNQDYFEFYLKYVELNPTAARLMNLSYSRAIVLDNASGALLAMVTRLENAKGNAHLKAALDALRYPNTQPATPYVVYEWFSYLEALRAAAPDEVPAIKERIFIKASTKGSQESKRTPDIGGFKTGAGGNRVFQEAVEFYIEANFVNPARFQHAQIPADQVTRFTSLLADTDKALQALDTVERYATPSEAAKIRRATLAISEKRSQRVRCENIFH